jgi:eukaryotic-like serine/threonine-protein kinase
MDVRVFGPLQAIVDGRPLPLGGVKPRALLAMLALNAGSTVSSERLIEGLWGEHPPASATKLVQVYVSHLRKALAAGGDGAEIVTRGRGYELRLGSGDVDARRFEGLVAQGFPREALALWRGPPLDDVTGEPFAAAEIRRLEGLRLGALELAIEHDLDAGRHREVIGELEMLVAEEPLRERLHAQRMLALYRSGRQADALEAYRHARALLVEEIGVEPGPELRRLHEAILRQDVSLEPPAAEAVEPPPELHAGTPPVDREAARRPGAAAGRAGAVTARGVFVGREPELAELIGGLDGAEEEEPAAVEPAVETPRGAFVGRERDLAELVGGLDDAFAGRGRLFLLVGEPGIGKSRLAEELVAQARARGARVLVGRCWEAGGAPAYWPWVQSLRPCLRDTDAASLRSQLREGAADVARLFPELRDLLADLPPATPLESEGARFRLFDSLTAFLKNAAATRPLVLVLDDLHAADEPSLLLLQFVARELGKSRLLIVGAYRDVDPTLSDPLTTSLTELAREPVTRTLALVGLGEADVARFIELAAPGASAAELGAVVHAETEGNPLFVQEIVRLLGAERGLDERAPTPLAIPESVREVIGRRLRHLSDECNRLLAQASVLGREFDLDALAGVSGLGRGAILELLDEGIEARVVSEVPGVIGSMRFAHALVRDAAYHRLSRSRRVRLHRQVGEALEALYSSDLDAHLAELAHHFFESAAGGNGEKAVDYARRAGAHAVAVLAYEEAVRLYEMALEALGPVAAATAWLRCELLLALADAQGRAGDGLAAKSTFLRAADLARSARLPEMLARGAVGYGGRLLWAHALDDERLVPLLEDGLSAMGEADSVLRVQLLARLAAALRHGPSRERRERISEEAIQIARRIGDHSTLSYALAASACALHGPHNADMRLAEGEEIVSLVAGTGDRERLFDGHEHSFWAAWELGDPDRRAVELASMTRVAEELRQPAQHWMLATAQATLALSQGRFAEAPELIERAAASGERVMAWHAVADRKMQLFLLRREQRRLDGFVREVRDHADEFPSPLVHGAILAHVYARLERTEEAEALLHELTSRDLSDWHVDEEWLVSICLLAETCAILGHTGPAAPLYALLLPHGSLNAVAVPELALGSTNQPLGILATLLGRFDDAARHFEEALRMNERMGARPWLAHTQQDHARMLLRRNGPGDRERAEELLSQAQATYHELGMHGDATKSAALARTWAHA